MDLKFASLPAIGILCNSWSYRLLFCVHSLKITFFPLVLFFTSFFGGTGNPSNEGDTIPHKLCCDPGRSKAPRLKGGKGRARLHQCSLRLKQLKNGKL